MTSSFSFYVITGHSGIEQGTGESFKFEPIDKLTPSYER